MLLHNQALDNHLQFPFFVTIIIHLFQASMHSGSAYCKGFLGNLKVVGLGINGLPTTSPL